MAVRGYFGPKFRRRYTAELVSIRYDEQRFRIGDFGIPPPIYTPPTLVQYVETTDWTTTAATKVTPTITWQAGDIIVAIAGTETSSTNLTAAATGGITLAAGTPAAVGSTCWANSWTATAASSGSGTVTFTRVPASGQYGGGVWVWRGASGVGARVVDSTTAQTVLLTRTGTSSCIVGGVFDFAAAATTGLVWTPDIANQRQAVAASGYTVYVADWGNQGDATAGTQYGISGVSATGPFTKIAVEIQGSLAVTATGLVTSLLYPGTPGPSPWFTAVPQAYLSSSQPLGTPAVGTPATVSLLLVTPPYVPVPIPPVSITSSRPLGNPAAPTPGAQVTQPPFGWPPSTPPQLFAASAPAAAVLSAGTPQPLVVGPAAPVPPIPASHVLSAPTQPGGPGPLVVSPPFTAVPIPPVLLCASQPLGNPAVPTPAPIVVSGPWTVKVPGAILSGNPAAPPLVTGATPGPLLVGPPYVPVPIPVTYLSASQPLGTPATGSPQPLVVGPAPTSAPPTRPMLLAGSPTTATALPLLVGPPFTLAPVPGAKVFAAPTAPAVVAVGSQGPVVVTPPWLPVPIPRPLLSASYPLGRPASASPQPLVVSPPQRWPVWTAALVTVSPVLITSCSTPRPSTGITTRPGSGTTTYATATTTRPSTGTTTRPSTGTTQQPC